MNYRNDSSEAGRLQANAESTALMDRARQVMPGGVNSPVRAFKAVGGSPPFLRSGHGSQVVDVDGNRYVDYLGSWGPLILGHARPEVVQAVTEAAQRGTSYGAPTEGEVLLAEKICDLFPSIEKVRLVNSGTEATMTALRLARAYTGRSLVVKFDGCYHGHSDGLLVQAGSGVLTLGLADSPGVPKGFAQETLTLPFNDLDRLEDAFGAYPDQIAAVILEPVPANMGVLLPHEGFLNGVLELGEAHGAVVIFDEVITGFRVALGGAQERFSLTAPMTCLGKVVGGGLPIGAYGGRKEIMDLMAPQGSVYQAGTLSGNPIAVAAGLKTLEILERDRPYGAMEERASKLCRGLREAAARHSIPLQVQRCGSMFTPFHREGPVTGFAEAKACDLQRFAAFFRGMLDRGIYTAPSQFEANFVSAAHSGADVGKTLQAADETLASLASDLR